jgi:uncharacterized protein (TIGR01777 family)
MKLIELGYNVSVLSRNSNPKSVIPTYFWNPHKQIIDREAILNADSIIHLAGVNIGSKRWTEKQKKKIFESRIDSADFLFNKVRESGKKIESFISASAIGYYGIKTSDHIFTENDLPGGDFLAETCRQWEESVNRFNTMDTRTVIIRSGVVLSDEGGVLQKTFVPFKMGLGTIIGSGNQYIPWIHIDDLIGIYIKAISDKHMAGVYNGVAPEFTTQRQFVDALARSVGRKIWLPSIPEFIIKMALGEMSGMITKGSRVSPDKVLGHGYTFIHPTLEKALKSLIKG